MAICLPRIWLTYTFTGLVVNGITIVYALSKEYIRDEVDWSKIPTLSSVVPLAIST